MTNLTLNPMTCKFYACVNEVVTAVGFYFCSEICRDTHEDRNPIEREVEPELTEED